MSVFYDKLYLGDAAKGVGVFTNVEIPFGSHILTFSGKPCNYDEVPNPYKEDFWVQVGPDLFYGPSGQLDDYINHSCDPNTGIKIVDGEVRLYSIKKIRAGKQLFWDYSTTMTMGIWIINCKCRADTCRKKVLNFRDLPMHVIRKYIDLGIVPDYVVQDLFENSPHQLTPKRR